jgi:beta-lactam-binding protein with PASTA domain
MMGKIKEIWQKIGQKPLLKHLLILVGGLLVLAILAHIGLLIGTRHSASRLVPELVGIPIEQAEELADRYDLKLHVNDSLYVPIYQGGTVLDQLPKQGVKVKPGRTVYLTINSYAQKMVNVPYVAGRSLRQAKNMLEVAGLGIEKIVYRPDMATNYVLEQYVGEQKILPDTKLQARQGSGVILHAGESGYVTVIIPKAVGLEVDQAKSRLWEQGLNIGTVTFDEGINLLNQKDARVYVQTPAAGGRARLGAKVDLKLTLDDSKTSKQNSVADQQLQTAAEELQREEAAEIEARAKELLDSLARVEQQPASGADDEEGLHFEGDDEFF